MNREDVSREGLTGSKILQPLRLLIPSNNYALAKVESFAQIDIEKINGEMGTRIRGDFVEDCC